MSDTTIALAAGAPYCEAFPKSAAKLKRSLREIMDLPEELVQRFAQFARIATIGRLRQVCSRWSVIIEIPPLVVEVDPCLAYFSRGVERFTAINDHVTLVDEDGRSHNVYIMERGTIDTVRRVLGDGEYCVLFPFSNIPENYMHSCVYDDTKEYRARVMSLHEIAYLSTGGRTRVSYTGTLYMKTIINDDDTGVAVNIRYTAWFSTWCRNWCDTDAGFYKLGPISTPGSFG